MRQLAHRLASGDSNAFTELYDANGFSATVKWQSLALNDCCKTNTPFYKTPKSILNSKDM